MYALIFFLISQSAVQSFCIIEMQVKRLHRIESNDSHETELVVV